MFVTNWFMSQKSLMDKETYLPLAKALAERRNNPAGGIGCYSSENKELLHIQLTSGL